MALICYIRPESNPDRYAWTAMQLTVALRRASYPHVIVYEVSLEEALREPPDVLVFLSAEDGERSAFFQAQHASVRVCILPENLYDFREFRAKVLGQQN